jgi:hypothetical protein
MGLFLANPEPLIKRTFRRPLTGLVAKPRYKSGLSRKKRPQPEQKTSQSGYLGRGETVFPVRPAQFIVVPLSQPLKTPERATCTHHFNRQPLLQETPLPRCHLQPQPHPAKDFLTYAQRVLDSNLLQAGLDFSPCSTQGRLGQRPEPPGLPTGLMASQPFRTGFLMPSQR